MASTNLSGTQPRVLEGRLAIITGAARGIGAAIAYNLASKGCSVIINYTSDSSTPKASEIVKNIENTHSVRALAAQADLGQPAGPAHLVTLAKNHFAHPKTGRFQIDIIIHNAGVGGAEYIEDVKVETFNKLYGIMVLGPLLLMQAALPYLPNDRSGRIIGISSVSSSMGFPKQSIYGGCKAALEAMVRTWSRELSDRATCNSVNPGPVDTDMFAAATGGTTFEEDLRPWVMKTPLAQVKQGLDDEKWIKYAEKAGGRPASSEEIAGVVGMLCTPESAWCTGSVVNANGGFIFGR